MDRVSFPLAAARLALAGAVTMLVGLRPSSTASPAALISAPEGIAPDVWEATAGGQAADVLLVLDEQADLRAVAELSGREERLRAAYEALRTTALRTQGGVRAELDGAGVAYRAFYVVNALALRGQRGLLTALIARPEVTRIVANPRVRQELPELGIDEVRSQAAEGIEWNVAQVQADDVWALGTKGEGIVVAGQDTGYDWEHPALMEQYRGYDGVTVTHHYNWHDAIHSGGGSCGVDSAFPCDDSRHGTHTMGTMVGDDGEGNQIGVAPGAEWIGCRNMDEGYGTPASYMECFEFFLAPYPAGGDPFTDGEPSLAPHVINNSWTCPPYEGCEPETLQAVVENVRAAGIVVVTSAGNSGSSCGSVQDPPAIYDAAFSVGATDRSDVIAGFSSRGPVAVDGSGRGKPDVSAPGVDIRSSVPGGGYQADWNGTSMAGPHVAGTVALLWSAAPGLVGDVDVTEQIIARTARAKTTTQGCGGDGVDDVPNNVYGWGIVDALAAVERAWLPVEISGYVLPEFPADTVRYSLTLTNASPLTLTGVTLSSTLPLSTTLSWADEGYQLTDRTLSWSIPSLPRGAVLAKRVDVILDGVRPGGRVVNDRFSVTANELSGSVTGLPSDVTIPWRVLLFPVYKNVGWGGR